MVSCRISINGCFKFVALHRTQIVKSTSPVETSVSIPHRLKFFKEILCNGDTIEEKCMHTEKAIEDCKCVYFLKIVNHFLIT